MGVSFSEEDVWMPDVVDVGLFVKPRFTNDWVAIDPASPTGKAFAARLGFPTPQKENSVMSAIPVETARHHLRVIENNKEQMGLLVTAKAKARAAFDYAVSLPKAAWAWAVKTFHLEAVVTKAKGIRAWLKAKAIWAANLLGKTGLFGAGALSISTQSGRKVLGLLLKPVVGAAMAVYHSWIKVENILTVEPVGSDDLSRIAKIRNWVAERMADVREFAFGQGTRENRYGVIGNLAIKALVKVGPFLALDSKTMLATKAVGFVALGVKAFLLAPMLPVAAWLVVIAQGAVVLATIAGAGDPALTVAERLTGLKRPGTPKATKAEASTAAKVAATVTEIPVNGSKPSNRAAKRAAAKRPAHAGH